MLFCHVMLRDVMSRQGVCCVQDYDEISRDGFFKGYDSIVWTVILLQAGGGLVSTPPGCLLVFVDRWLQMTDIM